MNFREFSQIQVWSKRTSRKLIAGLLVVLVGLFVAYWVETNWITGSERKFAIVALQDIDGLHEENGTSLQEFKKNENVAKAAVDGAERAAWTLRDRRIAEMLSVYLVLVSGDRMDVEIRKRFPKEVKTAEEKYPDLGQSSKTLRDLLRSELHAFL